MAYPAADIMYVFVSLPVLSTSDKRQGVIRSSQSRLRRSSLWLSSWLWDRPEQRDTTMVRPRPVARAILRDDKSPTRDQLTIIRRM